MRRVQYWFTAHWPSPKGELQGGVLIRRRENEPRKEVKGKVRELQGAIQRGDLVFVYETKEHGTDRLLKGKGKVVALLEVTDNSDFVEFPDRFVPVKETRWVAEVDCPPEVARDATGLRQLGKAPLSFGYPLKGTKIQLLENSQAVRLLNYVSGTLKREELIGGCWPKHVGGEDEDGEYQERARETRAAQRKEGPREPQFVRTVGGRQVRKDPRIAKRRFLLSGYRCEIDSSHQTFTSASTNQRFVEAHHLVPARTEIQEEFGDKVGLDHENNIVSLCPNCHRLFHHAIMGEKEAMLTRLYDMRKNELEEAGIKVTVERLLRYYQ